MSPEPKNWVLGFGVVVLVIQFLPGPSNVVPFWVCYGFLGVGPLTRTTKKVLHWRV